MDITLLIIGEEYEKTVREQGNVKALVFNSLADAAAHIFCDDCFVMATASEDFSLEQLKTAEKYIEKYPDSEIIFQKRVYKRSKKAVAFSELDRETGIVSPEEVPFLHAWILEGTIMRAGIFKGLFETASYGSFSVMKALLDAQKRAATAGRLLWVREAVYTYSTSYEGDRTFFSGIYERSWYEELLAYLNTRREELLSSRVAMDRSEQYQAAFLIDFAFEANLNNVNKHLFEENEAYSLLESFGDCLSMIEDSVLLDSRHLQIAGKNAYLRRWVYLILKNHDTGLEYDFFEDNGGWCFGYSGVKAGSFDEVTADIISMDYDGKTLTIEGRVSPVVYMNGSTFYIEAGGRRIEPVIKKRYALTKAFGVSIYKLISFHAELELQSDTEVLFVMEGGFGRLGVSLEFDSHFSRLTDRFKHSYWRMDKRLLMTSAGDRLIVRKKGSLSRAMQELCLWGDMLKTGQKKIIKYIPVRLFMIMKPVLKHKPLWLFIDKIYKGGDSSEYLWRYVCRQNSTIEAQYLLDEKSPDYERLKSEGLRPLKRHTFAHRRAFLYADWVIISNSTVFAFNDFSTKNSAYLRDLFGFKVACVQHGMSVQKIAVAQNRLRDNISLYFCASKYEIENLSKPVYDYEGLDILKLTGVPRYDGLISSDKRQILISPTWRMQAAVPVTKNESVMRDYNPLFKETSYYKVYNSLINDKRLLEAARQYGYSIVYVLHPIVSAQIDDFTKNPSVTILAGGGDMSYEKLLCESSLMVTDYSGVQFDFAYMRKPVVYLHHRDIPKHYEEGSFFCDTMGFGEIARDNDELIDILISYMKDNCRMKNEYKKRADDFFAFNDRENCARIYREMLMADEKSRKH